MRMDGAFVISFSSHQTVAQKNRNDGLIFSVVSAQLEHDFNSRAYVLTVTV